MTNSNINSLNYKHKELLYNLFYELTSEIKGCKVEIDEDEYQQNIKTIQYNKLITYVRNLIQILLKNKNDIIDSLSRKIKYIPETPSKNDLCQYESLLKQMEEQKRKLIKKSFQHQLQKESLDQKILEYSEIEAEYEEMKTKFKYEEGNFLANDRKDNEILIIRSENSILKNEIKELETKIKTLNNKLHSLQLKNSELIVQLEEKQKEITQLQHTNIGNHNNNNTTTNNNNYHDKKFYGSNSNSQSNRENKSNSEQNIKRKCASSSPQRKLSNSKFLKVPLHSFNNNNNANKHSTSLNKSTQGKIASCNVDTPDKTKSDFIFKYITNRHRSKKKSYLNKSSYNNSNNHSSSIKISKISNYNILNLSYKNLSTKNHKQSSINQGIFNQIHSYKRLLHSFTPY